MANKQLFASYPGARVAPAASLNREGALAYRYEPKHMLAQYAVTGCLNRTYYAGAGEQLNLVAGLARDLDAAFIAKTAVYARERVGMKDMPALLLAVLSTRDTGLLKRVFPRVIDNAKMLRNFVQIVRSGTLGRKSLGTTPKTLVQKWLVEASDRKLIEGCVGSDPSLADVVRMTHPKPNDPVREAFFGWLLGKPYAFDRLPAALQAYVHFRFDRSGELPDVPFQMLTNLDLGAAQWAALACRGGWHMARMNLNTFARHGVFDVAGMTEVVAAKLQNAQTIEKARAMPYQLLAAYRSSVGVPSLIREALEQATELALRNVERLPGRVVVCPDVSGSMCSPVTGVRRGASSAVRCIDVAALMAAAVLRVNRDALVLPFECGVRLLDLDPRAKVLANAEKLAAIGGGGTNCSAPLQWLNERKEKVDLVIFVSDNQSWVDARTTGPTETMRQWQQLKSKNPDARMVCIDVQSNGSTQALERDDVLNVGGFSDAVFDVVNTFASGALDGGHWEDRIEALEI